MIAGLLARKLVLYVAYSAAVTALPVLANLPAARVPLMNAATETACPCDGCGESCAVTPVSPVSAAKTIEVAQDTASPQERWWCRGPLRRGVRAAALFVTRPWRR